MLVTEKLTNKMEVNIVHLFVCFLEKIKNAYSSVVSENSNQFPVINYGRINRKEATML